MGRQRRIEVILDAALRLCQTRSLFTLGRAELAAASDCSKALIGQYIGNNTKMQGMVIQHAITRGNPGVILQALALRHPAIKGLDGPTLDRVLDWAEAQAKA
jgi:hypothetical protein